MQSSCLELKKERRGLREEGCRTVVYEEDEREEKLRENGCRSFA